MRKAIFITGTDTGVGKTVIAGLLARFLSNKGYSVITQKWIQTGSRGFSPDLAFHLKLMGKTKKDMAGYLPFMCPYTFKFPSSPHLAAYEEKRKININKIKQSFRHLSGKFDFVIIEAIGGSLVPLSKKKLVIDVAKGLHLPVLIVAGNKLGAINHTLMTIESVRKRDLDIIGIIFNTLSRRTDKKISEDNPRIISRITGERVLGALPRVKDKDLLYQKFRAIGVKTLSALNKG